jgi:hypothetical protein
MEKLSLYQTDDIKRAASVAKPFDPRTEISADANHIVKHLWIIFVVLPIACFMLYQVHW